MVHIINLLQYSAIWPIALVGTEANFVGLMNKRDLGTGSWNQTRLCVGDFL